MVDLRRAKRIAYEKVWLIRRLSKTFKKHPLEITKEDLISHPRSLENFSTSIYKKALMAMKVFFRDFLEKPKLVASFKFSKQVFKPKHILNRQHVKHFYTHLETPKKKALFSLYVSSGLRREEILTLTPGDIVFQKRMITPKNTPF